MSTHKPKVIIVVGPTASGKTALSLFLAQQLGGEIISADSRQIYRGLDIGTGKVTQKEMGKIPHHLIDIKDPEESYSAAEFAQDAGEAIAAIHARGHLPIIVGGTFFYIEALLKRKSLPQVPPNPTLRGMLEVLTTPELFSLLEEKDPERARAIDPHNRRRLVRALEIIDALGTVPAPLYTSSPYDALIIGIELPAQELKERINKRLHERMAIGMVEEAEQLASRGLPLSRMDELGLEYRYLAKLLKGEMTKEEMVAKLEIEIGRFAKRQRTWLRKMEGVQWYGVEDTERILRDTRTFLTAECGR